ncbi:MAG: pyruvate formate-lyase activating enzyme [Desulfobacteraceae bacterium]|nr:MAG: pyruvate formate-lyase activating enzyme [Desulfobacteraceae bacterium]
MSKLLLLDIGAGTLDLLCYDTASHTYYKAVAKSPILQIAEKATRLSGKLLVTGCEMGGGALAGILRQKAEEQEVIITRSAAATLHNRMEKVSALGIKIIEDSEAAGLLATGTYQHLQTADLNLEQIKNLVLGLGIPFEFDLIAVCAQDHGLAPAGRSHLDFRHDLFKQALDRNPFPDALLYAADEIPAPFSRLRAIAQSARLIPAKEIFVMDSGMAAILGATLDPIARTKKNRMVLDIATSHTLGAVLEQKELLGFFEYHTRDMTLERLQKLLPDLADGKITHERILAEGGHGAYLRKSLGFDAVQAIVATGPKRALLHRSRLTLVWGAPLGDNMMTGTTGLLEAVRRRKGWPEMDFF